VDEILHFKATKTRNRFGMNLIADSQTTSLMNNFFRALIAGYGAKKLGGGCFGTILVFIILWMLLGQCDGRGMF
jgi:hypothetical protein